MSKNKEMTAGRPAQGDAAKGAAPHAMKDDAHRSFMEEYYSLALRLDKAYAELARRHGETYYNLWAIDEIGRAEGGLTQKELAALLMAPKQTVNSIVAKLERRGLIRTLPSPTDKRSRVHILTDEGRRVFDKAEEEQAAAEALCIKRVGNKRIADMMETMRRILACIEESFSEDGSEKL